MIQPLDGHPHSNAYAGRDPQPQLALDRALAGFGAAVAAEERIEQRHRRLGRSLRTGQRDHHDGENKASSELEVEAPAINAEPLEPLPGMVKQRCGQCRYFFAVPVAEAEATRCPDCAGLGSGHLGPRSRPVVSVFPVERLVGIAGPRARG
jgi:hypothetical protein